MGNDERLLHRDWGRRGLRHQTNKQVVAVGKLAVNAAAVAVPQINHIEEESKFIFLDT